MLYYRNLAILVAVTVSTVTAYSGGAPPDTCEDMTPKHPSPPQSDKTFPYKISLNSNEIKGSEKAEITISGGDFKGFLLQVRDNDSKPVGTFDIPDHHRYAKTIGCSGKRVIYPNFQNVEHIYFYTHHCAEISYYLFYSDHITQYSLDHSLLHQIEINLSAARHSKNVIQCRK